MDKANVSLTAAEWNLMECLWDASPRTGREAVQYMKDAVGWTRSTTLTMLRRMTDKGLIKCDESGGMKTYSPLIRREDAALKETADFISRVYKGSVSMLMSAITQRQELSRQEIDELYDILRQAENAGRETEK